ncbi:MAG: ABC-2 transporter permease [Lachnospiraceae bacterium]|nr:ABC-2 transporter permease [Lachnospiraceae bacterium]
MLNMLKLDWLGMKKYRKKIPLALLTAIGVAIFSDAYVILPVVVIGMFEAAAYCFDAEERGKLNHLYLTLPISRGMLIRARYVMSLALQLFGVVIGVVLTIAFSAILNGRTLVFTYSFTPTVQLMAFLVCTSLFYGAFLSLTIHPTLFWKGYAKAKILGYALPMYGSIILFVVFVSVTARVEAMNNFMQNALQWVFGNTLLSSLIILGGAALLLACSYALSQKVYAKREF